MRTFRRKITIREKELIVVKGSGAEEVKAPHTCPLCNSPLSAETALLFEPMSEAADQEKNECLLTGDIEI